MSDLKAKVMEAKAVLWSIKFYRLILDFIFGFMLSAIIFLMLGMSLLYAIVPALVFVLLRFLIEYRDRSIIQKLRGRYENIDERLLTAIEYDGMRNVIVDDLLRDVTGRMDQVESSTFIDSASISRRIYVIIFLSFLLLSLTVLNLRSFVYDALDDVLDSTGVGRQLRDAFGDKGGSQFKMEMGNKWEASNWSAEDKEKLGAQSGGERPGVSEGPMPGKGGGIGGESQKDIYGEASSASIEGQDVDFRLHPEYGGEIEIRETGASVRRNTFRLEEVQSAEECVECVIGPEHEEVVRRYFEKILPET